MLAVGQLINVGTGAIGAILMMTKHQNRWFVTTGIAFVFSIALSWATIPHMGMAGAALGIACAVGGMFLIGLFQVKRLLGIWPYDRRYLKGLSATVLVVCALVLLRPVLAGIGALGLILMFVASGGLFVIMLLLMGLDDEDRDFLRLLRARVMG